MVDVQYSVPDMSEHMKNKPLGRYISGAEERIAELMNVKHVLIDLLSEQVCQNDVNMDLLRDVSEERDDYRRRFNAVKQYAKGLKPGQRITKEILECIDAF